MLQPLASWKTFVSLLAQQEIELYLKQVQLAQAMFECGRGTSNLFLFHFNPYGFKFRNEMSTIASPLELDIRGSKDIYCKFPSEKLAVDGYWVFLNRKVYEGWDKQTTPHSLLNHLINRGYVGTDDNNRKQYFKDVTNLFPEASHILRIL